ncbi:MAG: HDIG domain-containing protein [Armatimonadota bacterium]|nr:HDIG domain-containing protein [Armatimonadota bacterium]
MRRGRSSANNDAAQPPSVLGVRLNTFTYTRAAMAVATSLLLFGALYTRLLPQKVSLQPGMVAERTIIAPRSVTYTDTQATKDEQLRAREEVLDLYRAVPEAEALVKQTVNDIFDAALQVREQPATPVPPEEAPEPPGEPAEGEAQAPREDVEQMVRDLQQVIEVALSDETLRLLVTAGEGVLERLRRDAQALATQEMQDPITDNTDDLAEARKDVREAAAELPLTPPYQRLVADVAANSLRPNQSFDEERTAELRKRAAAKVDPVRRQIQAGDVVVAADETVTQRHIDMLKALGLMTPSVDPSQALSLLALLTAIVLVFGAYVARFAPQVWTDDRQMLLLCAALLLAAAGFRIALQWSVYGAITLGVATALTMMVAMLLGTRLAIVFSVAAGLLAGLVATGSDARLVIATIICSTFAAYVITAAGGRSLTVARAAGLVGVGNAVLFAIASDVFGLSVASSQVLAAVLAGLISASVAVVAVMALERVVGAVTDLRLMELANPNEPILHRLLTEAPGSYHSSVMVANLAEPAAEEIGANSLLVRTAAMYHDIGKLTRPYFFIENQFGEENPHEKLKPHLSALTLMAHVRDGYELAREIGLPQQVADIVRQHHGTSLASYPYHLALEQDGEENVNETDFRYPGPKPQTREAALVMLADSVEAAARTLVNPTHDQIEELVDSIIEQKVDDGQLDESPLTFSDLHTIRDSFVATLHGIFHQRLKYPEQEEEEEALDEADLERAARA